MIVRLTDVGSVGWIADIPAHDLSEQPLAWSSISNMTFRAGLAERAQGYAAGFDLTPTAAALGIFGAVQNDGTAYIITGATNALYGYAGTSETDHTGTTTPAATQDTKWGFTELTGFVVANETTKAPQFLAVQNLGTATNFADLTNWPASTTCGVIRSFKYFLVAGNMTESSTVFPYKVRWSTSATPGTLPASWTATTSNDSGSIDLSANYGKVVDMIPLGDQLAIYRERGITMMRYVGGTDATNRLVMAFNDVPSGAVTGMLALNCGVDIPGLGHVVLSQNDLYIFNGTGTTSVLDKRHRKWLRENIDATYAKRSFLLHNADRSEVWACIVSSGKTSSDVALVFNYADNTIGLIDMPNATCGTHAPVSEGATSAWSDKTAVAWSDLTTTSWNDFIDASKFRKTVVGSMDNKIYVIGNGTDKNGSTLTSQVERQRMNLGDPQRVKFFRTVWPRFDATNGDTFDIQVGTSMSTDEVVSWQAAQSYVYGTSRKVDVNKAGRFLSLRIRSTGGPWRIRSLDVDLQPQGMY